MDLLDILKEAIGIPTAEEKQKAEKEDRLITNIFMGSAIFLGLLFLGLLTITMFRKK